MRKQSFLLLLLPVALAQFAIVNVSQIPQPVYTNETFALQIALQNVDNRTFYDTNITFIPSDKCLNVSPRYYEIDSWQPLVTNVLPIKIDNSCKEGVYWVRLYIKNGLVEQNLSVPIQILSRPVVTINVSGKTLNTNTVYSIPVTISSNEKLRDCTFVVNSTGCELLTPSTQYFPTLSKSKSLSVKIKTGIKDCTLAFTVNCKTSLQRGVSYSTYVTFPVVSYPGSLIVSYQPVSVNSGESASLNIELIPTVCTLKNVRVFVFSSNPGIFVYGKTNYYIPILSAEQRVEIPISVDQKVSSGIYQIYAKVYYEDCNDQVREINVTIPVKVLKNYSIVSYYSFKGNELEITVANPNNQAITGVYVTLTNLTNATLEGSNKYFIGQIDENDYDTAYFTLIPNQNVTSISFTYTVYYTTPEGFERAKSYLVKIPVKQEIEIKEKKFNFLPVAYVGIGLLIGYFVGRRRKK